MRSMLDNLSKTFKFMKGHLLKYSFGIVGMTILRCTAALIEAYLLNLFLKLGKIESLKTVAVMFIGFIAYVTFIMLVLPVFQFWFNGQAKYGHGAVNKAIYKKYGELPVDYFEKNHSGKIMSLLLNDTWAIATIFMRHFRRVVAAIITIIAYLVPMFVMDWRITIIILATNVFSLVANVLIAKRMKKLTKNIKSAMENITKAMTNVIVGMTDIRIFNMKKQMLGAFKDSNKNVLNKEKKLAKTTAALVSYNYVVYIFSIVVFLFVGSVMVSRGLTTYASILAIMSLQAALDANFKELGTYFPFLMNGLASTERVYEFFNEAEERTGENAVNLNIMSQMNHNNFIQFKNVDFAYPNTEALVLKDFNLSVKMGEKLALIGESGSGKSSIAKLMLGFYDIQAGEINIGGQNVSDMKMDELRSQIAYVPQEASLFEGSKFETKR